MKLIYTHLFNNNFQIKFFQGVSKNPLKLILLWIVKLGGYSSVRDYVKLLAPHLTYKLYTRTNFFTKLRWEKIKEIRIYFNERNKGGDYISTWQEEFSKFNTTIINCNSDINEVIKYYNQRQNSKCDTLMDTIIHYESDNLNNYSNLIKHDFVKYLNANKIFNQDLIKKQNNLNNF